MERSKAERHVLQVGKKALAERRQAEETQRKQVETLMARRRRAAAKFKQKLYDQALRAAGIDAKAIAERQARDQETVSRFLETQKQKGLARAGQVNKQQQAQIAERLTRLHQVLPEPAMPAALIITTLESATEIILGGDGTTSIAPGQNLAHTQATISSGGYLGGPITGDVVTVDWNFIWVPPANGLLNATSFLQMNGSSWLSVNSDCNGGGAFSIIDAYIRLTQLNAQGQSHSDSQNARLIDQSIQSDWGDSVGAVQFLNLDDTDTVGYQPFQFPALAKIPLLITVSAVLWVSVHSARATLDFLSGEYRLNVPYVFLVLQPG